MRRKPHLYRRLREAVIARGSQDCYRCGQPVDFTLKWPDPNSFSLEHIKPRDLYPELEYDLANVTASHLGCNSAAGKRQPIVPRGETSRNWLTG